MSEEIEIGGAEDKDVFSECIGEFGKWQLMTFCLLCMVTFPCTFNIYALTFMAAIPSSSCARPNDSQLSQEQWRNLSVIVSKNGKFDGCSVRDFNYSLTYEELIILDNNRTRRCNAWNYETSYYGNTIVSEWDLVCDRAHLTNVAGMMFLLGVAVGGIGCGYISDRFGRKKTLILSLVVQILLGTCISFTPWYSLFLTLRCFMGFFSVSIMFSGLVLSLEMVGGKWLTICGVCYVLPVPFAYIAISGLAFYIKDWRFLQMAITATFIALLPLWWILPESPRWLLNKCEKEKLMETLKRIALFNGKQLPENVNEIIQQSMISGGKESAKLSILDLYKTSYLRRISFLLYIAWFCIVFVYYGIVLNLSNLGGDIYVNTIISGVVELPAIATSIIVLLKFGRRWPQALTTASAGLSCLLAAFFNKGDWPHLTFAMISRLFITSSNLTISIYTAELFPTFIRNLGLGASNASSGLALLLVPYIWNMVGMDGSTALVVLGLCSVLGALAILFLPESHGLTDKVNHIEKTSL